MADHELCKRSIIAYFPVKWYLLYCLNKKQKIRKINAVFGMKNTCQR